MIAKVLVFAACVVFAHGGLVRRDAPAPTASPLEELSKHASQFSKDFSEKVNTIVSAKDTEEVNKALKEGADTLLAQITVLSTSLNKAMADANGKAKTAITEAAAKLDQTVKDLKAQNPQVEQQTKELGDKIKATVQNTIKETEKLAKEVSANAQGLSDKVAPALKKAYDDFVANAEVVKTKIHEAAQKA